MGFEWTADDAGFAEGFLRIASEQVRKAIAAADAIDLPPAKRIHEARRRCKKLRALLRVVRPDFPRFRSENALIRDAARHLAEARDANVMRQTLVQLMSGAGRPIAVPAERPADDSNEKQVLLRFGDEMRLLRERIADWPVGRIDRGTIERGLMRTYRGARQARAAAREEPTDAAFHDWRKLAKYHWYQLNLLEACAGDVLKSEAEATGKLTDLLGAHHDLSVLDAELASGGVVLGIDVDIDFARDAIRRRQAELELEIRRLGDQVFAERPKALRDRVAAYLDSWAQREAAA